MKYIAALDLVIVAIGLLVAVVKSRRERRCIIVTTLFLATLPWAVVLMLARAE